MSETPNTPSSTNPQPDRPVTTRFGTPEGRAQLARADIILVSDPVQQTRSVLYGRETLEEIVRSGTSRDAVVVTIQLDSATEELDELETLIREIKGRSSFRPADLFPKFVIDTASFGSHPDLLGPVRHALDELRNQHRTLLPRVQLRFYYSVQAAGFTTAHEELRLAAERANEPNGYLVPLLTLGHLIYNRLPADLIKPTRCLDIVHGLGPLERNIGVRCRSLLVRSTPRGPAYYSRRMPRMRFGADRQERLVAFSEHALERICERTVYNWRDFGGNGDAFAFLDNCVYFEDCTDARGEPSFVVYNSCVPHFASWAYARHVLGQLAPLGGDARANIARASTDHPLYYRVGYCPVSFHGDLALATTLLIPGMNLRRGTPEGRLIENCGLPPTEVARMKAQVETQLSKKALTDSDDYSLIKWFHENGVPQVVTIEREVFKYD
ncbi:MAG: hypothetical protein L0241_31225 [Planctomycetia bacterium]|nr:hypothetical protein [Planctomycetia bacterium]